MKKSQKKACLLITIIVLIFVVVIFGLLYRKVERVIDSFSRSAQKATSQNTPLED